jgi:hypothetical protein
LNDGDLAAMQNIEVPSERTIQDYRSTYNAMSECLVFSLRKKTLRENTRPYRYHGLKIFTSLRLRFQDFQRLLFDFSAYAGSDNEKSYIITFKKPEQGVLPFIQSPIKKN